MASRVYARLCHKVKHTVNATAPQFVLATLAEPANLHRCHAASLAGLCLSGSKKEEVHFSFSGKCALRL